MAEKKKEETTVTIDKIDHARLVASNGVTFFTKFNKRTKACQVSLGRTAREDAGDAFVVSFDSIREFAKLILKYAGKGRKA